MGSARLQGEYYASATPSTDWLTPRGLRAKGLLRVLTLMPWAAYAGLAAVIVSALALVIGLSRLDWRGIALALVALIGGGLIAYVPWHYNQLRQTLPPIHDITTDPDNPPAFVAVVPLRQGEGINSVAYEGAKIAEQQRRAYSGRLAADRRAAGRCGIRPSARDSPADGLDDRRVRQIGGPNRSEPKKPLDGLY